MEAAELNLVKGQKVRITDGVFKGVIGEFVRIRHDRRVVVNIEVSWLELLLLSHLRLLSR